MCLPRTLPWQREVAHLTTLTAYPAREAKEQDVAADRREMERDGLPGGRRAHVEKLMGCGRGLKHDDRSGRSRLSGARRASVQVELSP